MHHETRNGIRLFSSKVNNTNGRYFSRREGWFFDSVWAESYGSDAVSVAAYVLASPSKIKAGTAIMQMQARTPTMVAMTAMSLNALSGNRFLLGIGPSGPQVVEGWYGQAYGKP